MVSFMGRVRNSATAVGFRIAVLLAMVVCPVMAGAVPAHTSASCHEGHEPGGEESALDALTCCAAVTAAASLQPSEGTHAAAACYAADRPLRRPAAVRTLGAPTWPSAPPLFVQHASLRI